MMDLVGRTIGNYQITEVLGSGGMATVFKATQASLGRSVALKIMQPALARDATFVERFRREAASAASLQHPNILPIFDYGQDGEFFWIAMALVLGGPLRSRIGQLTVPQSLRLISQLADALDYAHLRGIVHRDIKPSNVLMARDDWAQLADFGIAKILDSADLTATSMGIGTPEYMSPEQVRGERADGRSDLYSLGIMLFQMLTGRLPFTGENPMAILQQHLNATIPPPSTVNPAVPAVLDGVVARATAKDPALRFQTGAEFRAAVEAVLTALPITSARPADAPTIVAPPPDATVVSSSGPQPARPTGQPTPPPIVPTPQPYGSPPPRTSAPLPPQRTATPPPVTPVGAPVEFAGQPTPPPQSAPRFGGGNQGCVVLGVVGALLLVCLCVGGFFAVALSGAFGDASILASAEPTPARTPQVATLTPMQQTRTAVASPRPGATPTATPNRPAPTQTPSGPRPTFTPIPLGQPIFLDDMTTNRNQWGVFNNADLRTQFTPQGYSVTVLSTSTRQQITPDTIRQPLRSFAVEMDFTKTSGPDTSPYGIGFRLQGVDGYEFLVRGNGNFTLNRYVEALERLGQNPNDFVIEQTPAPPGSFNTGNARNRLKVVARGAEITLYINDQWVGQFIETNPQARVDGTFGIVVGVQLNVVVNAVRVFQVN